MRISVLLLALAVSTTNLGSSEQRVLTATDSFSIKFRAVSADRAANGDNSSDNSGNSVVILEISPDRQN